MAIRSIYKKKTNPMNGMGPLPRGMQSMEVMTPRPTRRPLARQPRMHTPYNLAVPGRKLKQRGRAVIDANPYRTSLKALQRGTNLPVQLIGGEVRGHGASKANRARQKQADQQEMINKALRNANKAPRQVRPAGVPDEDPLMPQAQVGDADLAQVEKLGAQIGAAGRVGAKGDMGPPGIGEGSGSGSTAKTEAEFEAREIEKIRKRNKEIGADPNYQRGIRKDPRVKRPTAKTPGRKNFTRPRYMMPVLDYRRKRYPF